MLKINLNTNYSYIALGRSNRTPANNERSKPSIQELQQTLLHRMRNIGNDDVLLASDVKNQQTPAAEIRDYIEKNKITMEDALSESIKKARFVFVGESHINGLVAWKDIVNSFERLKKETEARGEKLIITIELTPEFKDHFANKSIDELERLTDDPRNGGYAMYKVFWGARRAGLDVECIDPRYRYSEDGKTTLGLLKINERDKIMFDTIEKLAKPKVKILYYGGNHHCQIAPFKAKGLYDESNEDYISVATHLIQKYGRESVVSFPMVNRVRGFDGNSQSTSKTPKVSDVWPPENGIAVVPVGGPIPYSKSTKHDYIIIDSSPGLPKLKK